MIYLICFGASALFAQLAHKSKFKLAILLWSVLSIAITVTLAGLRDYDIGIDVDHYRTYRLYWGQASAGTFAEYMKFYCKHDTEYLFAVFIGAIAYYTNDFRCFLFLSHAVIITFVYIGAYRQRKNVNPALVMLLFYLYFYNHSLNVIRQYMAMAIVFAFLIDMMNGKYVKYMIVIFISMFVHATAIIGLGPMLIYVVLNHKKYLGAPKSRKRFVIFGVMCMVVMFVPLIKVAMGLGLLSGFGFYTEGQSGWPIYLTAFLLMEMFGIYVFRRKFRLSSPYSDFFLICSISYILLHQLGGLMNFGKRIAGYFSFINILSIASLAKCSKQTDNKIIINTAIISFSLLYWVFFYVIKNASQTYPYVLGV